MASWRKEGKNENKSIWIMMMKIKRKKMKRDT